MKNYLVLLLTIILIFPSCQKEEKIIESTLTDNWWEVDCIDLLNNSETGYMTINGTLDYGSFYFYSDGSYDRSLDLLKLSICNPGDPFWTYVIWPNGMGTPFGDLNNSGPKNLTWSVKKNYLTLNSYGKWEIIEHDVSSITFRSSRSDYRYVYRLTRK